MAEAFALVVTAMLPVMVALAGLIYRALVDILATLRGHSKVQQEMGVAIHSMLVLHFEEKKPRHVPWPPERPSADVPTQLPLRQRGDRP